LSRAGVPVGVLVAPMIPALNEKDVEAIIDHAGAAGALHWVHMRAAAA